jgi:hypothetical protein
MTDNRGRASTEDHTVAPATAPENTSLFLRLLKANAEGRQLLQHSLNKLPSDYLLRGEQTPGFQTNKAFAGAIVARSRCAPGPRRSPIQ